MFSLPGLYAARQFKSWIANELPNEPPPPFFFFYHGPALSGPTMTLSLLPFVQETKLKTLLKRREVDFTGIFGALW